MIFSSVSQNSHRVDKNVIVVYNKMDFIVISGKCDIMKLLAKNQQFSEL